MPDETKPKSELEEGLDHLGRALGGLGTRVFGPKIIPSDGDRPAVPAEAEDAIGEAADALGRVLGAAGAALQHHPLDPIRAVEEAGDHLRAGDAPPPPEGYSALSGGIAEVGKGFGRIAEEIVDTVAPRKKKDDAPG